MRDIPVSATQPPVISCQVCEQAVSMARVQARLRSNHSQTARHEAAGFTAPARPATRARKPSARSLAHARAPARTEFKPSRGPRTRQDLIRNTDRVTHSTSTERLMSATQRRGVPTACYIARRPHRASVHSSSADVHASRPPKLRLLP
ncbi:hypothetical protein PsYK624_130920 [Phanerochaete sordida]|uniref:Uncharacterized protein n=1 Tax=Phanerochaete sordida TaxID=48140 RepID=A0A9P3GMC8_9APHY|nr:hypothetical protein PsYK624_130920 [Phanerochaete sordida]